MHAKTASLLLCPYVLGCWMAAALSIAVCAQDTNYIGANGGNWTTQANWSNGILPNPQGFSYIDRTGKPIVRLSDYAETNFLINSGGISIERGGFLVTNEAYVGNTLIGASSVSLSDGGVWDARRLELGRNLGSDGVVSVSGTGTRLQNLSANSSFLVGAAGNGRLNIADGGLVESRFMTLGTQSNTNGFVNLSGAGSAIKMTLANSMLTVGHLGRGELTTANGSLVDVRSLTLGLSSSGTGIFNVSGVGSIARVKLADSHAYVGRSGTGTINIQDGSLFEASAGILLGFNQGGRGFINVTGSGSQLSILNGPNSNAYINIGNAGYGELNVHDGGQANLRLVNIGAGASATGKMVVSGAGSLVKVQSVLNIGGHDGSGVMEIGAGGRVESLNAVIGTASASVGQALITGNGSTWLNRGNLFVGSNGVGSLVIKDHARVVLDNGQLIVNSRSTLAGSGGTIEGSVRNFGSLEPGASPGSLIITGNYFHELGSVLEVEIGGALPGEYDTLSVFGNVDLNGGMLDVSTWNGFQLALAQEFEILNVGGLRTGYFRDLNGSLLNEGSLVGNFNGVDLFISYGGNGVSLYTPAVPEPANVLLIGSAMGMSLLRRRRT